MTYYGTVQNGLIVLNGGAELPDGTLVTVVPAPSAVEAPSEERSNQTIGQKMAALGQWAETQPCDFPADLAKNHDHYLHGVAKKS